MATAIVMPRLSDTMTEGRIVKWIKKKGDRIAAGDVVAEVETDKATLELEAFDEGTLLEIVVPENGKAPVGSPVAVVGQPGEDVSAFLAGAQPAEKPAARPAEKPEARSEKAAGAAPQQPRAEPTPPRASRAPGRVLASPLARRLAREAGVEIATLSGSGPGGRIVARDVEAAAGRKAAKPAAPGAPAPRPPPAAPAAPVSVAAEAASLLEFPEPPPAGPMEMTGMRRGIAERMSFSKREAPHFYLSTEVDMEELLAVRAKLKALGAQVSINDFVLKAAGFALLKVPEVNRRFEGDRLVQRREVDVGMAVALSEGLLSPVLRGVDRLSLMQVGALARDLAERARAKRLKPEEYQGGSLTVSNLGNLGVDLFSAIINPPQSAIVAVGTVAARAAVVDGQVVARRRTWLTLSCDHRVIDGATGARYLGELKRVLEVPTALLVA